MNYLDWGAKPPRTWRQTRFYPVLVGALLAGIAVSTPRAQAQAVRTASLPPPGDTATDPGLPAVLSVVDALGYRRIFELQRSGNWTAADRDIAALKDRLLLGEVLARRFLDPRYHASYGELNDWLHSYNDEPDARQIYALALKRHSPGTPPPTQPTGVQTPLRFGRHDEFDVALATARARSAGEIQRADQLKVEIRRIAHSDPTRAETLLGGREAKQLLDPTELDAARSAVAAAYLFSRQARSQLAASDASEGSGHGGADWAAGLADWRAGRYTQARQLFEHAAKSSAASPGQLSAAAFWAARSELRTRHPELVDYWLGVAAMHPLTFYGLLARQTLGLDAYLNFDTGPLSDTDTETIESIVAGRRALALAQLGDTTDAEAEVRQIAVHGDPAMMRALEALADRANMPGLSFQLATLLRQTDTRNHDRALFPLPRWTPVGGYRVDRALLFALMRQESKFMPQVRSRSGALGPMQIMPATARAMAQRLTLSPQQHRNLADPAVNLALAQEYIAQLQADDHVGSSLLLLTAAYNSGPAPIQHWLADEALRRDPLLFLENIPNRETRGFVERVLANYWIYRRRLGQPTPDLDALAAGNWPIYTAFDLPSGAGGHYAEN